MKDVKDIFISIATHLRLWVFRLQRLWASLKSKGSPVVLKKRNRIPFSKEVRSKCFGLLQALDAFSSASVPRHVSKQFHCASSSKREIQLLKFSVNSGSIPSSANNMASTSPSMASGPTSRRQLNPVAPSRRKPEQGHPRTTHMASSNRRAAVTGPSHPSATDTAKSNENYRRRVYGFSYGESSSGSGEKTEDVKITNASASGLPQRGACNKKPASTYSGCYADCAPSFDANDEADEEDKNYTNEYEAFFSKDHQSSFDEDGEYALSGDDSGNDNSNTTVLECRRLHSWDWPMERINEYFERTSPAQQTPPRTQKRQPSTPLKTKISGKAETRKLRRQCVDWKIVMKVMDKEHQRRTQ